MIGDGWTDEPSVRPTPLDPPAQGRRRVAVITGTRAEFGLLKPVMQAIAARDDLELAVIAAGAHLIAPATTFYEVKASFNIADAVPIQIAGRTGRSEDAEALSRGIGRFARSFDKLRPDWVVVLGDRIEAFAAAAAASVAGYALAHVHGGDRAEGIADEAMRHAISKLAHLHLAATAQSAERLERMGEVRERIHIVGSPAMDGLEAMPPLDAEALIETSRPPVRAGDLTAVYLMHPVGRPAETEEAATAEVLRGLSDERPLLLHPNFDAGREGVLRALSATSMPRAAHLSRESFIGLLRLLAARRGVLVGNSSAALIEAAALHVPVVDIGPRQSGRERCANVVHIDHERAADVRAAIARARDLDLRSLDHPYGNGRTGPRVAALLASTNPHQPGMLRKRNTY